MKEPYNKIIEVFKIQNGFVVHRMIGTRTEKHTPSSMSAIFYGNEPNEVEVPEIEVLFAKNADELGIIVAASVEGIKSKK